MLATSDGILQSSSGKTLALPLSDKYPNPLPNEYIQIAVTDSDIGLAPDDLERIFDSFEQVEFSTSRSFQRTGLGLALSEKFIDLHGGIFGQNVEAKARAAGREPASPEEARRILNLP